MQGFLPQHRRPCHHQDRSKPEDGNEAEVSLEFLRLAQPMHVPPVRRRACLLWRQFSRLEGLVHRDVGDFALGVGASLRHCGGVVYDGSRRSTETKVGEEQG